MKKILFTGLICILLSCITNAQIRLPQLVSNGMVLQRNQTINIWGWASANENVTLTFREQKYSCEASAEGSWMLTLPAQQAGGPYTMLLKGKNEILLKDIYIGDVWLCSGQSNMELPMRRVESRYREEIKLINTQTIRQFWIPRQYDFNNQREDISEGAWKPATPENIMDFSAVAYFFAKHIQKNQNVPVGLINSSMGGSPVEAWISEEKLKPFKDAWQEQQKYKNDEWIQQIRADDKQRNQQWFRELSIKDKGRNGTIKWNDVSLNDSSWSTLAIPGFWSTEDLKFQNGTIWFRKDFTITEDMLAQPAKLELGCIVDADSVFINGQFIGNTTYRYPPRIYKVPAGILKVGKNNITIKVISQSGNGGFVPDKKYELTNSLDTILLSGNWKYKIGAQMPPLQGQTFIRWKPSGLYNAMIHPLHHFTIKGAIWYQGESNVGRAKAYEQRLSAMIKNWREEWQQDDFPFLIVQLANFLEEKSEPTKSEWAQLRAAQFKVATTVPNAALACTIDLGEWNDIHPLNKDDVGNRLALAAEKIAYNNRRVVSSGPTFKKYKIKGKYIEIRFNNTGSGMVIQTGNKLLGFSIAGEDGKYVWAQAKIKGNKIIVWNDQISKPRAVRYAWADNPANANLYNKEGLPAVPFRTDDND
ncbi:sialate O-acetylesterase [Saccharicrinis fermentans]|uniref:Sialate O-acetylesterase n=1 Tax=Saccharicrinis fermentans DSM 9555 = JCM 21142 TaxID=869213 RepID=W7Y709_9BACT|nr:sialate O-acetylesterase [Saccharicrinis fermentans]GAF04042.1 hypothetical protein JCM21142_72735 [Saccharicrinis fermentans DSM 9555 = JCM 21142]